MLVLASKEIKLSTAARRGGAGAGAGGADVDPDTAELEATDPGAAAAQAGAAAMSKVLSKVAKKGMLEQTLPLLAQVRTVR